MLRIVKILSPRHSDLYKNHILPVLLTQGCMSLYSGKSLHENIVSVLRCLGSNNLEVFVMVWELLTDITRTCGGLGKPFTRSNFVYWFLAKF